MSKAIEAHGVGKRYWIRGNTEAPTLIGAVRRKFQRQRPGEFWALRGLSFDVPRGITVGVIGPNGCGKSTTLGLVAGTIKPTEGTMRTEGRISSLLELGAGFHSELTGRENVFLYASLLGIEREYVVRRFDAIVAFAGLEEFIDVPVKNYSSGMYVRLGFAVATEVEPDILLVDEVLAVGDAEFQQKCLHRIRQFQRKGKTILFVSHDLGNVKTFCDEVVYIEKGRMIAAGEPGEIIEDYLKEVDDEERAMDEHGSRRVNLVNLRMVNGAGETTQWFTSGEPVVIELTYDASERIEKPVFGFSIKHQAGTLVYGTNTQIQYVDIPEIEGQGQLRIVLDRLDLRRGHYFLSVAIHDWDHVEQFHRREDWYDFAVRNRDGSEGMYDLRPQFELGAPGGDSLVSKQTI